MLMKRRWRDSIRGFTLVELIVVIAIIGILATITIVGFSRYQADTRDARRVSSVTTITEALEKYYDENGEYPGCAALTGSATSVASQILGGINVTNLLAPQATSQSDNSIKCETLSISGADFFEYSGDGSTTCSTGSSCLSYTLKYKEESTGVIKEVTSRRQTSIATSNVPTVTVGTIGADNIDLSWTPTANASSYSVQRATNSSFTTGLVSSTASSTSTNITGLSASTQYYFRVAGVASGITGSWSSTVTGTTLSLGAPTINSAVANSAGTQLTIGWTAGVNAVTYTMQRSTSNTFTSPTSTSGIATTSTASTGLTTGTLYYFRTQSVNGAATSNWSNTYSAGATTPPTSPSATAGSCGALNVSWTASPGATSYNIQTSTASNFSTSATATGYTGTSGTVSGLAQGVVNYVRVYALVGSGVSQASSTVSATTGACAPAAYTISAYDNNGTWTATSNAVCSAGTTPYYEWYANGGLWTTGTDKQTVGYALGYGQGITLSVNTRCNSPGGNSSFTGASNTAGYTRPVPAPTWAEGLNVGSGRRVWTSWYDVCGGVYEMWLIQGGYTENPATPRRWLGASPYDGSTPDPYSEQDNRVWNSSGTITYRVRASCNGVWSGWSNPQSASV